MRRSSKKKVYSLTDLIKKQPKKLQKYPEYPLMMNAYLTSKSIREYRFTSKVLKALHSPGHLIDHLDLFIRKHNLPRFSFFPYYFAVKKRYLTEQAERKKKHLDDVKKRFDELDPRHLAAVRYFHRIEKNYHPTAKTPLWIAHFIPKTKAGLARLKKYQPLDWYVFFCEFREKLKTRYSKYDEKYINKVLALYIFNLPVARYPKEALLKQYRLMALKYHPDKNGDPKLFQLLHESRKILLD